MYAESYPARLFKYLKVFQCRGMQRFDPRLLEFAEHAELEIRWLAYCALANYEHPDVRALALNRIMGGRTNEGELRLFVKNREPGDWTTISEHLVLPADPFDLHSVLQNLLKVFEDGDDAETRDAMLVVYEHSPCGMCRASAVRALVSAELTPAWVTEECAFDAYPDTREDLKSAE